MKHTLRDLFLGITSLVLFLVIFFEVGNILADAESSVIYYLSYVVRVMSLSIPIVGGYIISHFHKEKKS